VTMLTRHWRVFICDDQPALRQALTQVVASLDGFHPVGEAEGGDACIAQLAALEPDLLILDVNMPQGGPAVAQAAKKILPNLKIIVYTAISNPFLETAMREAGADEYIVKTGRLKPLREAIYRAAATDRASG
jgi:DNA-binding NarL/FixJ family response regulator